MKKFFLFFFLLTAMAFLASPISADTIYKCAGKNGELTYTNDREKGRQKGCRVLLAVPERRNDELTVTDSSGKKVTYKRSDFPVVKRASQESRDRDRVRILQNEWDQEKMRLIAAEKRLAEAPGSPTSDQQEEVRLHKTNLAALEKEMSRIKK